MCSKMRKSPDMSFQNVLKLLWFALICASPAFGQALQECVVHDPELQGSYSGSCSNGMADGHGSATGLAHYAGEFKAGRKHGRGVKIWPSGDRYEGEFANDLKEGTGVYTWGRNSPWAGEKYTGDYRNDRRHGHGVYQWPDGDRYAGPWDNDIAVGTPTPRMYARSRAHVEHVAAAARMGNKVCRSVTHGIGTQDWLRGRVVDIKNGKIAVRLDDAGRFQQAASSVTMKAGDVLWEPARAWTPCL